VNAFPLLRFGAGRQPVEDFAGVGDDEDAFVLAVFVVADLDLLAVHIAEVDFVAALLRDAGGEDDVDAG